MCNTLHEDAVPIPEEGVGYKLMGIGGKSLLGHQYNGNPFLEIIWSDTLYGFDRIEEIDRRPCGFCFFLNQKEAIRAKEAWHFGIGGRWPIMYKIRYWGGLGSHQENEMIHRMSFTIALCKRFKIISNKEE